MLGGDFNGKMKNTVITKMISTYKLYIVNYNVHLKRKRQSTVSTVSISAYFWSNCKDVLWVRCVLVFCVGRKELDPDLAKMMGVMKQLILWLSIFQFCHVARGK